MRACHICPMIFAAQLGPENLSLLRCLALTWRHWTWDLSKDCVAEEQIMPPDGVLGINDSGFVAGEDWHCPDWTNDF
jgi:hypothetical protein